MPRRCTYEVVVHVEILGPKARKVADDLADAIGEALVALTEEPGRSLPRGVEIGSFSVDATEVK